MITVTLNRTEFEYDIHSLIKAFFPKEDVELYYTKEAHADEKNVACTNHSVEQEEAGSSHFSIDYADDRISIAWDDAPDGPVRRTFAVDFSNRTETKNALKEHLYRLLEEETGQPLPWGTLTGIRPTKIPMQMLDEGKTKEEIASYMKQTYLASLMRKSICRLPLQSVSGHCFPGWIIRMDTVCISAYRFARALVCTVRLLPIR